MAYLEEVLSEFRKGAKIRKKSWDKNVYIYLNEDTGYPQGAGIVYTFSFKDLVTNYWEFYKEPIDWDYIIKNKCLCWFWNNTGKTKYLNYLQAKEEYAFRDEQGACWENCRPALRDEVTFYEDRIDE